MGDECFNASKRRKIEEAVIHILKASDLETVTEFEVRSAAAARLGFELTGLNNRLLVRQLVDSFLLSTAAELLRRNSLIRINDKNSADKSGRQQQKSGTDVVSEATYDGKIICKLSGKRRVTVHDYRGSTMVSIREFDVQDGNLVPVQGTDSGISLTSMQWSSFRNSIPSIEEAIAKLECQLRSKAVTFEIGANVTNLMADSASEKRQTASSYQEQTPATRTEDVSENKNSLLMPPLPNQLDRVALLSPQKLIPDQIEETEIDISTSVPSFPSQRHPHHTANAVPIHPPRFDGRNYHSWRTQMEIFLNQSNIAYVLSELCPTTDNIRAEAAVERWKTDDYLCHHNILNSLCDTLFQLYSQKNFSARELWEELKSVYNNDFGTRRSNINNYIHYQMIDGVPILDQVQELHNIADSVIASGIWIEESFHVGVIVSKLPPSWKDIRRKLMQEEFLPLDVLMHRIRVEAESCSSKSNCVTQSKLRAKKDENKRGCFGCGKEGHIRKYCPSRDSYAAKTK